MQLQDFFNNAINCSCREKRVNNLASKLYRFILRSTANGIIPWYFNTHQYKGGKKSADNVIVSFTSFPARIDRVWITVESLKRQSVRPYKVILWLSEDQFPGGQGIPDSIRMREDDLFEIQLRKGDLKPHKKYYYAFTEYPEYYVVTVDDDIIYNSHLLENLLAVSSTFPSQIICNRTTLIKKGKKYSEWGGDVEEMKPLDCILATGVGGVLYPPHCYDETIFDIEAINKTCLFADDLWLSFHTRYKGTTIVKTNIEEGYLAIKDSQKSALANTNNGENQNDIQLNNISEWAKNTLGKDFFVDMN